MFTPVPAQLRPDDALKKAWQSLSGLKRVRHLLSILHQSRLANLGVADTGEYRGGGGDTLSPRAPVGRIRHARCCASDGLSSEWMMKATGSNASLLRYFYPHDPDRAWTSSPLARSFRPVTRGCKIVADACYCIHVTGSPVKAENPFSWRRDGQLIGVGNNPTLRGRKHHARDAAEASAAAGGAAAAKLTSDVPLGSAAEVHALFRVGVEVEKARALPWDSREGAEPTRPVGGVAGVDLCGRHPLFSVPGG